MMMLSRWPDADAADDDNDAEVDADADAKQMSRWPDADADSDDDAVTPRSNLHRADLLPGPSLVVGLNSKEAQAWFSSQRSAH